MWKQMYELKTSGGIENFKKAAELCIRKPQVLSKVYCGATILREYDIPEPTLEDLNKFIRESRSIVTDYATSHQLLKWDDIVSTNEQWFESFTLHEGSEDNHDTQGANSYIQYTIPKNQTFPKMINVWLMTGDCVICVPLFTKHEDGFKISLESIYKIQFSAEESTKLTFSIWTSEDVEKLEDKMLMSPAAFKKFAHYCDIELSSPSNTSLKLVNLEQYSDRYIDLKKKYADFLITNWTERTDAQKFVFEDIAIATYLLLLFEQEQKECGLTKKQSFLDIGCGNGLLVYLLTKEGYFGTGFDIRKRKIWDWFEDIDLRERTVIPSSDELFPEYDWLVGNHSDEMTPWIPVISSRSGYDKKFFVLPCCPHDFNGKFRERKSQLSVYQAYLDYVEEIVEVCGFQPERDMLKIPSTKRTCIIGRKRTYKPSEETEIDKHRSGFIQSRCERLLTKNGLELNAPVENNGFVPRAKEEKVRNCTQIDYDLKSRIVKTVFEKITSENNPIEINGKTWNRGSCIPLSNVVECFDKETLKLLKNECGGLQTLLKNHHQIFQVVKGQVSLRFGENSRKRKQDSYYKTCLCFYFVNHPDGCWQSRELCSYAHGAEELKTFKKDER